MSRHVLPNGIVLWLLPQADAKRVSFCYAFPGARFFAPGEVHLVEHMIGNETARYVTYEELVDALDGRTKGFEALTGQSAMTLTFTTKPSHCAAGIDLSAAVILGSRFRKNIVSNELECIQLEGLQGDDLAIQPEEFIDQMMFQGHQLGQSLLGTADFLRTATVNDVRRTYRRLLRGPIVIAVAGRFEPGLVRERLRRRFGHLELTDWPTPQQFEVQQTRPRIRFNRKEQELLDITIGWPLAFGFGSRRRVTLSVMNNHFGDADRWGSRMWKRIRGSNGLAYAVSSEIWLYGETGSLTINTTCKPERAKEVMGAIALEVERIRRQTLTDREFRLTVASVKDNADDFSPARLAKLYAESEFVGGNALTYRQFARTVNQQVTRSSIRTVARDVFQSQRLNVVIAGNVGPLNRRKVIEWLQFN